ncbi:MAG: hypothetical protein JEZ11_03845 [Desulfobacterales bacterium]|nr:hypothetical protein [Desulfobacterales bacterium]
MKKETGDLIHECTEIELQLEDLCDKVRKASLRIQAMDKSQHWPFDRSGLAALPFDVQCEMVRAAIVAEPELAKGVKYIRWVHENEGDLFQ